MQGKERRSVGHHRGHPGAARGICVLSGSNVPLLRRDLTNVRSVPVWLIAVSHARLTNDQRSGKDCGDSMGLHSKLKMLANTTSEAFGVN